MNILGRFLNCEKVDVPPYYNRSPDHKVFVQTIS